MFSIAMVSSNCDHLKIYIGNNLVADIDPDRETFPHLRYPPFVTNIRAGVGKGWGDLRLEGYIGGKLVRWGTLASEEAIGAGRQPSAAARAAAAIPRLLRMPIGTR